MNLLKESYNMFLELRRELETCEGYISGEAYNNPRLNLLMERINREINPITLSVELPDDSVESLNQLTLRQWIAAFNSGEFEKEDRKTQCDAGWYDWFCKDTSLKSRLYKLVPKVMRIAQSKKINQDTMYVWFKNNCPAYGRLYDDFRISDITTSDVLYTVVPRVGHEYKKGVSELWGKDNNFEGPLVEGKMKDIYKYFEV